MINRNSILEGFYCYQETLVCNSKEKKDINNIAYIEHEYISIKYLLRVKVILYWFDIFCQFQILDARLTFIQ